MPLFLQLWLRIPSANNGAALGGAAPPVGAGTALTFEDGATAFTLEDGATAFVLEDA